MGKSQDRITEKWVYFEKEGRGFGRWVQLGCGRMVVSGDEDRGRGEGLVVIYRREPVGF